MKITLLADLHLNPGDNPVELYGEYDGTLMLVGDTFNILPFGMERWDTPKGYETCIWLGDMAPHVLLLEGNHDPIQSLKKLPLPDNVFAQKRCETPNLVIRHGHEFTYWWFLRWIAPQLCTLLADRKWWFKFCERRGWTSTHKKMDCGFSREIALYWAACMNWCEKHKRSLIVGHSHNIIKAKDEIDGYTFETIFRTPVELEI